MNAVASSVETVGRNWTVIRPGMKYRVSRVSSMKAGRNAADRTLSPITFWASFADLTDPSRRDLNTAILSLGATLSVSFAFIALAASLNAAVASAASPWGTTRPTNWFGWGWKVIARFRTLSR